MVPKSQPGVFLSNNSRPISRPSNYYQGLTFQGMFRAPRPSSPVAQIQSLGGYADIHKIKIILFKLHLACTL